MRDDDHVRTFWVSRFVNSRSTLSWALSPFGLVPVQGQGQGQDEGVIVGIDLGVGVGVGVDLGVVVRVGECVG